MTLPTDEHNLALWLFANLEQVSRSGSTSLWEGTLPTRLNFDTTVKHIEDVSPKLAGVSSSPTRTIGFHPANVHVYEDVQELITIAANRRRAPDRFTVRTLQFSYPAPEAEGQKNSTPDVVSMYLEAVRLWSVFKQLADVPNGSILFVASYDAQIDIRSEFSEADLKHMPSLGTFAAEFASTTAHADQKRSIVRSVLIDHFRPRHAATLGELIHAFEAISTDAKRSLSMYMAEFSVKKVTAEVERQNLEDTLSLNKTLSDIQNQLLALPAAILLAGATIKSGETLRNYAVLAGVAVFCIFIWTLVGNQRHSVDAIASHVQIRKKKVSSMPADSGQDILALFPPLEKRVSRQKNALAGISLVVLGVIVLTAVAVADANSSGAVIRWLSSAITALCQPSPTSG